MPTTFIKRAAKKGGESKAKVEDQFKKVAKAAKKEGMKEPYAVATAAVKKSTGYKPKKKK